jgi:hypothetical protein
VFNTDSNTTIHLTSISGTTPHFHCSFFDSKVRPFKLNPHQNHINFECLSGCASPGQHDIQCGVPRAGRGPDGEHALHPHVRGHNQVPGQGQQCQLSVPVTPPGRPPDAHQRQLLTPHPHAQSTSKSYTGEYKNPSRQYFFVILNFMQNQEI